MTYEIAWEAGLIAKALEVEPDALPERLRKEGSPQETHKLLKGFRLNGSYYYNAKLGESKIDRITAWAWDIPFERYKLERRLKSARASLARSQQTIAEVEALLKNVDEPKKSKRDWARYERAAKLRREGKKYREIAAELGLSIERTRQLVVIWERRCGNQSLVEDA